MFIKLSEQNHQTIFNLKITKKVFKLFFVLVFSLCSSSVFAKELTVTPFLIDEVVEPRRTVEKTILLKNNSSYRKYVVYATVNEISLDLDGKISKFIPPVEADNSRSVTSWIQISRGRLEVEPKGELSVPLTIKASPYAEPGEYYAFVGLVPAKNRPQAEEKVFAGEADGVIVKISIPDRREASLKIKKFAIDRFVSGSSDRKIKIELQNNGDLEVTPDGEIIFYNNRGTEIAAQKINQSAQKIPAGGSKVLLSEVPDTITKIGKVRADLKIKYKGRETNFVKNSVYFYVLPFYLLLIIFFFLLLFVATVIWLLRRWVAHHQRIVTEGETISLYVKDGHSAKRHKHDIDLSDTKR